MNNLTGKSQECKVIIFDLEGNTTAEGITNMKNNIKINKYKTEDFRKFNDTDLEGFKFAKTEDLEKVKSFLVEKIINKNEPIELNKEYKKEDLMCLETIYNNRKFKSEYKNKLKSLLLDYFDINKINSIDYYISDLENEEHYIYITLELGDYDVCPFMNKIINRVNANLLNRNKKRISVKANDKDISYMFFEIELLDDVIEVLEELINKTQTEECEEITYKEPVEVGLYGNNIEMVLTIEDIRYIYENRSPQEIKSKQYKSIKDYLDSYGSKGSTKFNNAMNYISLLDKLTYGGYSIIDLINHKDIKDNLESEEC